MAIRIKAVERNIAFDKDKKNAKWAYVLQPDLYNQLSQPKVVEEASLRSGLSKAMLNAAWNTVGEIIKAWATEGHSVAIPGLGTMRFGVRGNAVEDVDKVSTSLISRRRIIFTPSVDVKQELERTSISLTCYDRNGKLVRQVTADDIDNKGGGSKKNTLNPGGGGGQPAVAGGDGNTSVQ